MDKDQTKEEDHNRITARVLEYYREHSQNADLPRYFSGEMYLVDLPGQNANVVPTLQITNLPNVNVEERITDRQVSPTSSAASNKKLEWDNGADIGYDKVIQKSISLPILTNYKLKQKDKCISASQVVFITSSSTDSSSSSEEIHPNEEVLNFLKMQVGLPMAESTPNLQPRKTKLKSKSNSPQETLANSSSSTKSKSVPEKINATHNLKMCSFYLDTQQNKYSSSSSSSKILSSKCVDSSSSNSNSNAKKIPEHISSSNTDSSSLKKEKSSSSHSSRNSSFPLNLSNLTKLKRLQVTKPVCVECIYSNIRNDIETQTDYDFATIGVQTEIAASVNQSRDIIYAHHEDRKSNENSSSTQTESCIDVSNCNSFEFLYGSDCTKKETDLPEGKKLKRSSVKKDLTQISSFSEKSSSSSNRNLSNMLSEKQSNDLINDMEKNMKLLQKLVKSKRYDNKTKEYYISKIVKKLMKNNYDDESSVYSDKITPNIDKKSHFCKNYDYSNESSKENINNNQLTEKDLHSNVAWVPGKFQQDVIKPKDSRFTLPSKSTSTSEPASNGFCHSDFIFPQKSNEDPPPKTKFRDWKENKTLSEKLLESKGDGDHETKDDILFFAKRERDNQLNWINNEIKHLEKLKTLLEKREDFEQMYKPTYLGNPRKSTAVYVITTKKKSETGNRRLNKEKFRFGEIYYNSTDESGVNIRRVETVYSNSDNTPTTDSVENKNIKPKRQFEYSHNATTSAGVGSTAQSLQSLSDETSPTNETNAKTIFSRNCPIGRSLKHFPVVNFTKLNGNTKDFNMTPMEYMVKKGKKFKLYKSPSNSSLTEKTEVTEDPSSASSSCPNFVMKHGVLMRRITLDIPIESKNTKKKKSFEVKVGHKREKKKIKKMKKKHKRKKDVPEVTVENKQAQTDFLHDGFTEIWNKDKNVMNMKSAFDKEEAAVNQKKNEETQMSEAVKDSIKESEENLSKLFCGTCKKYLSPFEKLDFMDPDVGFTDYCPRCSTKEETLTKIQDTINELEDLDKKEEFYNCIKGKCSKNKRSVSYFLNFDHRNPRHHGVVHSDHNLKEIKHERQSSSEEKKGKPPLRSLKEYLEFCRPGFVREAEERRKAMNEITKLRQEKFQIQRDIVAMTNSLNGYYYSHYPGYYQRKRLFSSKEMKQITARQYKKLPEVQQKLHDNRNKQIKKFNRLMVNIFNKKLQQRVLQGIPTTSVTTDIINL